MSPHVDRAKLLGEELLDVMKRLAEGAPGRFAVLFLDRSARLQAFEPEVLRAAAAGGAVELADELAASDLSRLTEAAERALDVEGLLSRAQAVAAGVPGADPVDLVRDALSLATVAELLPGRARILDACELLEDTLTSAPEAFAAAIAVLLDRTENERPAGLPEAAQSLLATLGELPELAAHDELSASEGVPAKALRAADDLISESLMPRPRGVEPVLVRARAQVRPSYALAAAADGLETKIAELAAASEARANDLLDELQRALLDVPCAWLRAGLRGAVERLRDVRPERAAQIARFVEPHPGRVPLLLWDEQGRGWIAELRIRRAEAPKIERVWTQAEELQRTARDTIRQAYLTAARATPLAAAPYPFAQHRIELVVPRGARWGDLRPTIDGRSLGLAASIAFASAWLEVAPPADAAATGAIAGNRFVVPVEGITAKGRALSDFAGGSRVRLLAAPIDAEELRRQRVPVEAISVAEVAEALRISRLDLSTLGERPYGSVKDRERQLARWVDVAQTGALDLEGEDTTWGDVGDRLERAIVSLRGAKGIDRDLVSDRCWAAMAYLHDGDVSAAERVISEVDRPACTDPRLRSLLDILAVGRMIDEGRLSEPEGSEAVGRLRLDIAELRAMQGRRPLGRLVGTLGRAHLHSGETGHALPLLREAIELHAQDEPHQTARSRMYLAAALRIDGQAELALGELERAQRELETETRRYSAEYEQSCRTFLEYERARCLVEVGGLDDALSAAARAEAGSQALWWPRLGILRTRVWALRGLGRDAEAEETLEMMSRIIEERVPPSSAAFAGRILDEARDQQRTKEVY